MRWDLDTVSTFSDAEQVYYKESFTSQNSTFKAPSQSSLYRPFSLNITDSKVILSDSYNHRVLIWSDVNDFLANQNPTTLLGQNAYDENIIYSDSVSGSNLQTPQAADILGGRLFVADRNRNRVLVWNTVPTTTVAADFAYGQPDMATTSAGLSANEVRQSSEMCLSNGKFVMIDKKNSRVLIFNAPPTTNVTNADLVLGAVDMVSPGPGVANAQSFANPQAVVCSPDGKLVVSDLTYNRLLVWNTFPTSDNQAADIVVGQEDFASTGVRPDFPSARSFSGATGLTLHNGRLFLADFSANRILYWNSIPTTNDTPADGVLGQDSFTEATSGFGAGKFQEPLDMAVHNDIVFVVDSRNNRIIGLKNPE
jgi:hypothetical protein